MNWGESGECAHPSGLISFPLMSGAFFSAFVDLGADADFLTTGHRRDEFIGISEPPPFYGNTQEAKGELLLRYWRALPPELQSGVLALTESMAHIYLGFDKRAKLAGGVER